MSAERGWIGEPQPTREWHASHYSRIADKIASRGSRASDDHHRSLQRAIEETWVEQEAKNAQLRAVDHTGIAPLRIADRYVGGPRRHVPIVRAERTNDRDEPT
jgi:hypothetical protein